MDNIDDLEQIIVASRNRDPKDPLYLLGDFNVKCKTCKHSRKCGKSLISARDDCRRHTRSNPHHVILIMYTTIYEIWQDKTMDLTSIPPF